MCVYICIQVTYVYIRHVYIYTHTYTHTQIDTCRYVYINIKKIVKKIDIKKIDIKKIDIKKIDTCRYAYICIYLCVCIYSKLTHAGMYAFAITGWQRPIGCLKLQVIFRKRATNHRAFSAENDLYRQDIL